MMAATQPKPGGPLRVSTYHQIMYFILVLSISQNEVCYLVGLKELLG